MYLTVGDYRELYLCLKDHKLLDKFKEYEPYKNTLINMISIFDLFSNIYSTEQSCKYMEKVIRFVTRYNIDDTIIDKNLIGTIKNTGRANTDIFFFMIYSFVKPEEMVKISFREYITSFYILLLTDYNHWNEYYTDEVIMNRFKGIKLTKFRDLMIHLVEAGIDKLYKLHEFTTRYGLLAVIMCDTYLYDKDYSNIDKYLNNIEYYVNKLFLNGKMIDERYSSDFFTSDFCKPLFDNIDSFINDSYGKKTIF